MEQKIDIDRRKAVGAAMVKLLEQILTEENSTNRIQFGLELSGNLGTLLALPVVMVERLVVKLEEEQKTWAAKADALDTKSLPKAFKDLLDAIKPQAEERESKAIATLKAFLKVRPALVDAVEEFFGQRVGLDGQWVIKEEATQS